MLLIAFLDGFLFVLLLLKKKKIIDFYKMNFDLRSLIHWNLLAYYLCMKVLLMVNSFCLRQLVQIFVPSSCYLNTWTLLSQAIVTWTLFQAIVTWTLSQAIVTWTQSQAIVTWILSQAIVTWNCKLFYLQQLLLENTNPWKQTTKDPKRKSCHGWN